MTASGHAGRPRTPRDEGPRRENRAVSHDDRDVDVRAILRFVAILVGAAAVIHIALWGFQGWLESDVDAEHPAAPPMATLRPSSPPAPRLETVPRADLAALRASEDTRLGSYGWVDRDAGVVHIPVERAMTLVLERGLPARPAAEAPPASTLTVPSESSLSPKKGPEVTPR